MMEWINSEIIVNIYYASISELILSVLIISALFFAVDQGFRAVKERIYRVWYAILCLLLAVTILIIFYFTLYGREQVQTAVILIPFYSYYLWLNGNIDIWRECLMNVLLFYPIGLEIMLLGFTKKRTLTAGAAVSVLIEAMQGIFRIGTVEIDDVIHNTAGVLFAVLVMTLCGMLWRRIKNIGAEDNEQ